MRLKDATDADLSRLRLVALEFQDNPLWAALVGILERDRVRIFRDLTDATTSAEKLKFAQGELAQVNRDILLIDEFLKAVAGEQQRRQRVMERSS